MASAGRFATILGRSSLRIRPNSIPKTLGANHTSVPASSSSTSKFPGAASRFAPVLGSLGTMLPLHSAIAAARLKSNIAMDTSCWSWLSQDLLKLQALSLNEVFSFQSEPEDGSIMVIQSLLPATII